MKNLKRNKKGFTLVELIIVIAIIGILAAVLVPTMIGVVGKANAQKAGSDLDASVKPLTILATDFAIAGGQYADFPQYVKDAIAGGGDNATIASDIKFAPVDAAATEIKLNPADCTNNTKIIFVQVEGNNVQKVLGGISFIKTIANDATKFPANSYGSTGSLPTITLAAADTVTLTGLPA